MPPVHSLMGRRNILRCRLVGQSGTDIPASWLVTRPPRPMSRNVATAFSTANQNSAGLYLLFILKQKTAAGGVMQRSGKGGKIYFGSNVKFCAAPSAFTSISAVCTPSLRCAASKVYLPGGTFLMVNFPSAPLTAKYG